MAMHWILFFIFIMSTTPSSNDAHLITVTSDGTNSNSCLSGNTSCHTLDFAIFGLNQSNTTIRVDYSHVFNSTVHINSEAKNVSIKSQNATDITITCSERGQGLVLSHLNDVAFHGIHWINCSIQHNSSVLISSLYRITGLYTHTYGTIKIYSGLVFYNVTDLSIVDCSFSTEGGVGLALFDVGGTVNITNSHFYNNTIKGIDECDIPIANSPSQPCSPLGGGLYIELTKCGFKDCLDNLSRTVVDNTQYNIDDCIFELNNNSGAFSISVDPSLGQNNIFWPFGRGGGMSLNILGDNSNNTFSITHTVFQNNTAQFGGGMNLVISDNARKNMVQLSYVNFTFNKATEYGGGFRTFLKPENAGTIHLKNVSFQNNTANAGGGGDFAIPAINDSFCSSDEPTIRFEDCEWYYNTAVVAGAALQCLNSFITISPAIVKIHFHNCLLSGNLIPSLKGYTLRYGQGALYTLGVQVEFSGHTDISYSLGTALVISSTQIALQGTVAIHHNQGARGSGIYLDGLSWILMMNGLNLTFYKNDAFEAGAAIYYVYDISRAFNTTKTCFMKYEDSSLSPQDWNVSVTFSENIAVSGGNAIFLTDPPDCYWQDGFLFQDYSIFSFENNSKPHISTKAHNITFDTSSESVHLSEDGYFTTDVMPGSPISIPVVVMDYFQSKTVATLDTKCFNIDRFKENDFYGDICADEDSEFRFVGSRVLTINGTLGGFQLGGPKKNSELMIVFKTLDAQPLLFGLRINFTSCRNGYIYKNDTKFCECSDNREDTVRCFLVNKSNVTVKKPCVRVGYWGTKWEDNQEYITASCTSSNCRTDCAKPCMNSDFAILVGWCTIPDNDSDFCVNHHAGPLCALCEDDYCLGYDGKLCLPCKDCNTIQTLILFLSIIIFWIVIIIGILLLLQLNFQIGSGYMYGFVYYFSVLPFITTVHLQSKAFSTFVSLFQGIVHLNPEFLSYTSLCFKSRWKLNLVHVTTLDYIHPFIISIIIYLLLQVNRRCCRSAFTQSSPIHVLCIILLLVQTSLFQTSIDLIEPINLGEHTYVKIQPDIPYGDPTEHLLYLMVALIVEVAVVLFAVSLFLAPWLMRCGMLQKVSWLKHIVDEYQACYRRNHRWFAGYYLLCRQLVALTPFLSHQSRVIFFQQILNATILLVHVYIQPYKERWLNMLDTIFLFDLTLLTFLRIPHSVTTSDTEMMYVLQYFLIAIPCVYFLLVSVVILGLRVKICCDKYQKKKQQSTNERVYRKTPKAQPAREYDELDGETLSVEMSDCTRQTLGMRNKNLISHAPTSRHNAAASPLRDASTDLDDVELIPPASYTPKWIKSVTSFLKNHVRYWRSRRSNTTEQQPFGTRSVMHSLDYSRSTHT